jgi:hypothetical protein
MSFVLTVVELFYSVLPSAHIIAKEFSAVSQNNKGGSVCDGFIQRCSLSVAYKATDSIITVIVYVTHTDLLNGKV